MPVAPGVASRSNANPSTVLAPTRLNRVVEAKPDIEQAQRTVLKHALPDRIAAALDAWLLGICVPVLDLTAIHQAIHRIEKTVRRPIVAPMNTFTVAAAFFWPVARRCIMEEAVPPDGAPRAVLVGDKEAPALNLWSNLAIRKIRIGAVIGSHGNARDVPNLTAP